MCVGRTDHHDSFHFLGRSFRLVIAGGDVGQFNPFLGHPGLVANLPFLMKSYHQLVDYHSKDGAKERGEDRDQEPIVIGTEGKHKQGYQ